MIALSNLHSTSGYFNALVTCTLFAWLISVCFFKVELQSTNDRGSPFWFQMVFLKSLFQISQSLIQQVVWWSLGHLVTNTFLGYRFSAWKDTRMFLWRKNKETLSSQIVLVCLKANSWPFLGWVVVSFTFGFWMLDELFFFGLGMFLFFFLGCF